jgi:hypothetical protein
MNPDLRLRLWIMSLTNSPFKYVYSGECILVLVLRRRLVLAVKISKRLEEIQYLNQTEPTLGWLAPGHTVRVVKVTGCEVSPKGSNPGDAPELAPSF